MIEVNSAEELLKRLTTPALTESGADRRLNGSRAGP